MDELLSNDWLSKMMGWALGMGHRAWGIGLKSDGLSFDDMRNEQENKGCIFD
jgi:hypothetical protein